MHDEPGGFALEPEEGRAFAYLGGTALFKITNEQTGAWSFSIETFPGGFGSVLHNHPTEHSGFYILSGQMRVKCGDLDATAGPGGFVWLPQGVPHAFKVVSEEPCTWINIQGPSGDFRRYIEEITQPSAQGAADPSQRAAAAQRHNLEIIGPSPF
jgi:uncharacterized RmlC-like cupin family protein